MPHREMKTEEETEKRKIIVICIIYYFASARHSNQIYVLLCLRVPTKPSVPYTENKNALYLFALCSTTMRNAVRESVVLECVTELYARCPHSSNEIRVHIPTVLHVPTKSTYSTRQYIELRIDWIYSLREHSNAQKSNRIAAAVWFVFFLLFPLALRLLLRLYRCVGGTYSIGIGYSLYWPPI